MELCLINTEIITSEKKAEKLNVSIFFKPRHAIYLLCIVFTVHTNTAVMMGVERCQLKVNFFLSKDTDRRLEFLILKK